MSKVKVKGQGHETVSFGGQAVKRRGHLRPRICGKDTFAARSEEVTAAASGEKEKDDDGYKGCTTNILCYCLLSKMCLCVV